MSRFLRSSALVIGLLLACSKQTGSTSLGGVSPTGEPSPLAAAVTEDPIEPSDESEPAAAGSVGTAVEPPTLAEVLAPLTDEQIAIFFGSAEDPVPLHRGGVTASQENKHYLSSNEKTLDAFHSTLEGLGGGYLGVGTDQGYLFIGWARSEIAWLVDYDPAVQEIHELYRLFFLASDTPEQMVALWSEAERPRALSLIEEAHDEDRARSLRYWYRNGRGRIEGRLRAVRRRMAEAGVPTVFDDQATYDHVRRMVQQRRIRAMRVNLLEREGLAGIGEAARALGVPLSVLYLSNAEQYWKRYAPAFRESMASLPWADDAVLLRTMTSKAANGDYRYNVQPIANYQQWLAQPFVGNVHHILHAGPKSSPQGITMFVTDGDPQESPAGRRWQAKQAESP